MRCIALLALFAAALSPLGAATPSAPMKLGCARAFMEAHASLLFGRLVHVVDAADGASGGHFELYVHAATLAPAYEIRFRLADAAEAAALRDALARHREARRGSFFVLLAYDPARLDASAPMAELGGVRAADLLPLPAGTAQLQGLLDAHPALRARLPRHPDLPDSDSWDWD